MKFYLSILCLAGALLLGAKAGASDLIPRTTSDADFVFTIQDLPSLIDQVDGHPMTSLVKDSSWLPFKEILGFSLGEESEDNRTAFEATLEDEFDLSMDELLSLFAGSVSLSIYDLIETISDDTKGPEFVLMVEYAGSEEQLDELMRIQFERNSKAHEEMNSRAEHELIEEKFMGETIYLDEVFDGSETYIEDGYALVDGIWILATPAERLKTAIEAVKFEAEDPLSEMSAYLRVREAAEFGDVSIFVNLKSLLEPVGPLLNDLVGKSGLAMAGVTGHSLKAALALEDLSAYSVDLRLDEEALFADLALVFEEKSGLSALLAYESGSLPEARYVPTSAIATSVDRFDLSDMLSELEAFFNEASPALAPLLDIQLQNLKNSTGVDLRSSVIENFGSEIVTYTMLSEVRPSESGNGRPEQVVVIEIDDADAFSKAVEAFIDAVPGMRPTLESKEFEGENIYVFRAPELEVDPAVAPQNFSFCVTRNYLIFAEGDVSRLQETLVGMQQGSPGFWQQESTHQLFDASGIEAPVSRYYLHLGAMIRPIIAPLMEGLSMFGLDTAELKELPSINEVPYVLISESYEEEDGFFSRVAVLKSE